MVRKLAEDNAHGVLVVPKWVEALWYNVVEEAVKAGRLVLAFDMWPVFEAPVWMENSEFRGRAQFPVSIFMSRA